MTEDMKKLAKSLSEDLQSQSFEVQFVAHLLQQGDMIPEDENLLMVGIAVGKEGLLSPEQREELRIQREFDSMVMGSSLDLEIEEDTSSEEAKLAASLKEFLDED